VYTYKRVRDAGQTQANASGREIEEVNPVLDEVKRVNVADRANTYPKKCRDIANAMNTTDTILWWCVVVGFMMGTIELSGMSSEPEVAPPRIIV